MASIIRDKELIHKVSADCGIPKHAVRQILKTAVNYITDELMYGESVEIRGLGIFSQEDRAARQARDLRTGEKITVPSCRVIRFRTSRTLRKKLWQVP